MPDLSSELTLFRDRTRAPAVAAARVSDGGLDDIAVVGTRRRGGDVDATVDDRWHVGSCAKALTAALYARLVETGRTDWDVPIASVLPDLEHLAERGWRTRTVEHLLHCRGGTRPNLSPSAMRAAWADRAPLVERRTRVARDALAARTGRAGRFVYSNVGYVVVGAAIDRLAGEPYEAALRTHLLDPLGIRSLGSGPPPALRGHAAKLRIGPWLALPGPALDPDGPRSDNPAVLSSAGTLHLTLPDWAAFVAMMLGDGADVLSPRSVERLFAPPAGGGPPMAMGWMATPGSACSTHAFQGSNTFWAATAMLDRRRRRAVLVVCNDGRASVLAKSWALAERLIGRNG